MLLFFIIIGILHIIIIIIILVILCFNIYLKFSSLFNSNAPDIIKNNGCPHLHSIDNDAFVAGPWHAAFGEIVKSKIYLEVILTAFVDKPKGNYVVFVNPSEISKATGQKKANIKKLAEFGYVCKIKGDNNTNINSVKIKEE